MKEGFEQQSPRGFDEFEVTLGDEMRGERATLGKSLLDVQRDLRIKATYISGIENCDSSVFQTPGFIAGYVRSYARYLSMDPEDCFVRFCQESGFSGVHSDLKPKTSSTRSAAVLSTPIRPANVDPIARPRVPMTPQRETLVSQFSLSAMGSVGVLCTLVLGLAYGGWTVVQEVQRVQFVPVNQTPGVTAQVETLSPSGSPQTDNVVGLNETTPVQTTALDQLYRPQELDIPQLIARDGPISTIDPASLGRFAQTNAPTIDPVVDSAPIVVAEAPPTIDVFALKPAWVRIYFEDGSVLHEQVLDAGQRYRLPSDVESPLLRAGNAGDVFVLVGDKTFGPVGSRGGVARNVSLARNDVTENMQAVVDLFSSPLDPPLNLDALNAPAVAEVSVE